MRKITLLFASALIAGLCITSCSSDDDTDDVSSVVGKWNFSTQKITSNGITINEGPYNGNEQGCNTDYLELFPNHTAVTGDYDETCELELISGTYNQNGNVLNVSGGGISATFEIVIANSEKNDLKKLVCI